MSYYGKDFVKSLILERAKARREREINRVYNEGATRLYIPYSEWLRYAKGVTDWHDLRPYKLWDYYNEYQLECLKYQLEYEHPSIYGLYNTLF